MIRVVMGLLNSSTYTYRLVFSPPTPPLSCLSIFPPFLVRALVDELVVVPF